MLIDQAIFASGQTDQSAGFQLLGCSPGISAADARELAAWGPSHDALRDSAAAAVSFNFHPLPSGAFCVSRTVAAGAESSGRGRQIYTQCLVVGSRAFTLFANNAFNVWRATQAASALIVYDRVPEATFPVAIGGGGNGRRPALARRSGDPIRPGRDRDGSRIGPGSSPRGDPRERGLRSYHRRLDQLPAGCVPHRVFFFDRFCGRRDSGRFEFWRSTTIRAERQRLNLNHGLAVVDVSEKGRANGHAPATGWAGFVAAALAGGKTSLLAAELAQPLPALGGAGLNDLGDRLRNKLRTR